LINQWGFEREIARKALFRVKIPEKCVSLRRMIEESLLQNQKGLFRPLLKEFVDMDYGLVFLAHKLTGVILKNLF